MDDFSPLTRKFVATGLVVISVLVVLNVIVFPLSDWHAARQAALADARRQIAVQRQILARGPALKQQVKRIRRSPQHRRGFLVAASPALAGARLENRLKAIVQSNGGTLRSTRMQPHDGDGPERVRVTLDFTADPDALLKIIHGIETAVPWLIADNVHIHTMHVSKSSSTLIKVRMSVDAFVWREAA